MSTLYLAHFGLTEPPFSITPNPHFFYQGGERGRLLEAMTIAVTTDEGITIAVGEVGSGKTMLARLLAARLEALGWRVAYLANPAFAPNEIVAAIAHDLGITGAPATGTLLDQLNSALIASYQAGQRTVVIIDEAHAMPAASLDEVRRLANLETATHKLLQIVLFAQPELTTLLADERLRPLRERIVHRFLLPPLAKPNVREYLEFRLRAAGLKRENPFTPAAIDRIARTSGGIARRINLLADKALLAAFARGSQRVERQDVIRAERELDWGLSRMRRARSLAAALLLFATLAGAVVAWRWLPLDQLLSSGSEEVRAHPEITAARTDESTLPPAHPPPPPSALPPSLPAQPAEERRETPPLPPPQPAPAPTMPEKRPQPPAIETVDALFARWRQAGYTHAIELARISPSGRGGQEALLSWKKRLGGDRQLTLAASGPILRVLIGPYRSASAASQALLTLPADVLLEEPKLVELAGGKP
ncbi:hypothetical protein JCM16106_11470 [Hydrogenophilus islandicus]